MGTAGEALRVVLDTNVLVSALVLGGRLAVLVDSWRRGTIRLVFTRATFDELDRVLDYPKFEITLELKKRLIVTDILPYCMVVEAQEDISGVCPDPDDDKFLSCALAGAASVLVTGDKALLGIRRFRGVEILSPAEFIAGSFGLTQN